MPIQNADYSNINFEEMAASIGLKAKHIPMLIASFLEESEGVLNSLGNAVESRDFSAIQSHAHFIKGSAGNLRFNEVYEMAKEIELSAENSKENFDYSKYLEAIKLAVATIPS